MEILRQINEALADGQLNLFKRPIIELKEGVKGYQLKRYLKRLNRLKNAK